MASDRICVRSWVAAGLGTEDSYVPRHDVDERFRNWKRELNLQLVQRAGVLYDDLPDTEPVGEWFDGGMKPNVAAVKLLILNGYDLD